MGSSVPATTGDVRAWVRSNAWVRDKGCPTPDMPKAPPKAEAEAAVSGVVSMSAVELRICTELLRFLPANAGVSNFSGLVNASAVRREASRSSSSAVGLVMATSCAAWEDSTISTPSVEGSAASSSSSSCSTKSDLGPGGLGILVKVSAVPNIPLVQSRCIWLSGCVSPGASMPAKLWCIFGAIGASLGAVSMGALLYFVRLGLTWYVCVVESAATRRGEWERAWAWACSGAVGSSCGMAPSRGCGGTVKVEGSADTAEARLSVDVVKCRPCSSPVPVPARCLSACESCDGSCSVERQWQ